MYKNTRHKNNEKKDGYQFMKERNHSNVIFVLKYGSRKKNSFWCRCSTFLSPTFVEIKNSFTRTLLTFNSKNFGIICYQKNTDENEPI